MGTNSLSIQIVDSIDDATDYVQTGNFRPIQLDKAVIVAHGTIEGNPTVDIEMTDSKGNRFVGIITGNLIISLAKAIEGVKERTPG